MKRVFLHTQTAMAWLLLYVVVSGAIGLALQTQKIGIGFGCTDHVEAFGLLGWNCQNSLLEVFFNIALGLPRLATTIPAIVITLLQHALYVGKIRDLFNALPFLIVSVPLISLAWIGTFYWCRKQRIFGIIPLMLLITEIMFISQMS